MDDARSRILARLRAANAPKAPPLSQGSSEGPWTTYDDPVAKFKEMVVAAGGQVVDAPFEPIAAVLSRMPIVQAAQRIDSFVAAIQSCERDDDPHSAADSDLCILNGEFGVAENGAVFVRDLGDRPRAAWFLCQHSVVVVDRREIVHNMHQAMARVSLDGLVFGLFVSGPSKTADIEQAMVIGAHGARSLVVVLT